MTKPLTKIRSNMDLKAAAVMREAELIAHQAHYAEACRQTNEAFAGVVRREAEASSMTDVAKRLGVNRTNLHRITAGASAA